MSKLEKSVSFRLTPEGERYVNELVKSGSFKNRSAVIRHLLDKGMLVKTLSKEELLDWLFVQEVALIEEAAKTGDRRAFDRAMEIDSRLMFMDYKPVLKIPLTQLKQAVSEVVKGQQPPMENFSWREKEFTKILDRVKERLIQKAEEKSSQGV